MTQERRNRLAMLANREWLDNNITQIQSQYREKWIAILDGKVVAADEEPGPLWPVVAGHEEECVVVRIPTDISTPI